MNKPTAYATSSAGLYICGKEVIISWKYSKLSR